MQDRLWALFVAVGDHWTLGDDASGYWLRFQTFLQNRIDIDPLYTGYYREGAAVLDELIATQGAQQAFDKIFLDKPRIAPAGLPSTRLESLHGSSPTSSSRCGWRSAV